MTSPQYRKGRRKEQEIVKLAKLNGLIAFRSAGSKSAIDVVTVDAVNRVIELIQSKVNMSDTGKKCLENKYSFLNGIYTVRFKVC